MIVRLNPVAGALALAMLVAGPALAAPASADSTPSGNLPVPSVVRIPVTYSWSGRASGTSQAASTGGPHFVMQGEAYSPVRTVEERSAALDAITRARYLEAMAKNKVRGAGIPVHLKSARY